MPNKIVCLMGPTASGKSSLSLSLAEHLPIEIISVDASLVYEDMNIGTAKPTIEERKGIAHHLIDILPPSEAYSASSFVEDSKALCTSILKKKKLPLLVGGTMLYFKALQTGLSPLPGQDKVFRMALDKEAEDIGWLAMHQKLAKIDPLSAKRIHPNDPQRIQRALEVHHLTGQSMSQLWEVGSNNVAPFSFINLALMPSDRSLLHEQIAKRFDNMLENGFLEEVQKLKARNIDTKLPAMRAVGYRQALAYLAGEYDYQTMREKAIVATRQLAKRQMTWLRNWSDMTFFPSDDNYLLEHVLDHIQNKLSI